MRILSFCILLSAALAFGGCKSKKQATDTTTTNTQKAPVVEMELTPEEFARQQAEKESRVSDTPRAAQLKDFPDSLLISLERTPCFGQCPTYVVKFYKGGTVTYEGKRFVENEGLFQARVSQDVINGLLEKAKAIDFLNLKDKYDGPVTDLPSTIMRVQLDSRKKQVVARFNVPDEVRDFGVSIDEQAFKINWQKVSSED